MLEELSLVSLAAMACVCAGIRERCFMVSLWARPVRRKWGRVLGVAACKEWEAELGDRDSAATHPRPTRRGSCQLCRLSGVRVVVHLDRVPLHQGGHGRPAAHTTAAPSADTVAAWYRVL
jgi:hypothetical protein